MAYLAPSLERLFSEVNARWPTRDNWSDGWLGDPAHSSRTSDHNPDRNGMVHAADIDATLTKQTMGPGTVGDYVCAQLLTRCRDGRLDQVVSYVIYKGRIYSRPYGYSSRAYTGVNSHHSHVHVSILYTGTAENYAGPWGIRDTQPTDWFDVATREDLAEVVANKLDLAISAENPSLMNAIRLAIEAERADDVTAVVNRVVERLGVDSSGLSLGLRKQVRTAVDAELNERNLGT